MVDTLGRNQGKGEMRIKAADCAGLVVDIQERLFPHMHEGEKVLARVGILLEGFNILKIPVLVTEQYPRGLGQTLPQVRELVETAGPIEKISFSCCGEENFRTRLALLEKKYVVICGIEAHVCVLQTVIDLLESELRPVVVADCISSRNPGDLKVALERMRSEGAVITTSESILFELTEVAGTDSFKQISRLVK